MVAKETTEHTLLLSVLPVINKSNAVASSSVITLSLAPPPIVQ